jgi:hypothetical protein
VNQLGNRDRVSRCLGCGGQSSRRRELLNPAEPALRVMTMAGLSVFFEVHTDLEEAVASC